MGGSDREIVLEAFETFSRDEFVEYRIYTNRGNAVASMAAD